MNGSASEISKKAHLFFFFFNLERHKEEVSKSTRPADPLPAAILAEDYSEIVDEEGDYSTPASECFFIFFYYFF